MTTAHRREEPDTARTREGSVPGWSGSFAAGPSPAPWASSRGGLPDEAVGVGVGRSAPSGGTLPESARPLSE